MIKTNNKKLLGVLVASTLALGIAVPTISNGLSGSHSVVAVAKDKKDDSKKSESLKELEKKLAKLQAEQKELKGIYDAFVKRGQLEGELKSLNKKIAAEEKILLGKDNKKTVSAVSMPYWIVGADNAAVEAHTDEIAVLANTKQDTIRKKLNKVNEEKGKIPTPLATWTDDQKANNNTARNTLDKIYQTIKSNGENVHKNRITRDADNVALKDVNAIIKKSGKTPEQAKADLAKVEKEIKEVEGKIADLKGKKPTESPTTPGDGKDDGGKDGNKDKDGDKDKKGDNCVGGNCQKQHQHQTVNNYGGGNGGNGNYNAGGGRAPVAGGNYANGLPRLPKTGTSTGIVASSLGALLASGFGLRYFVRRFNKNS